MEIKKEINREEWSKFVENHPNGNIFQTPEMYEVFKNTKNYEPIFLTVTENDKIKALLLASVIKQSGFGSFSARSIIQGGPLFTDAESLEFLLKEYDKIAKKKALFTQIRNLNDTTKFKNNFLNAGYKYEEHLNFLIDLTKTKDELFNSLDKRRRYGIRKAKERGIVVEELNEENLILTSYKLLKETYKNAKLPLADISLFRNAFKILKSRNMIKTFMAKYEDNYIATIVLLVYKNIIYDWYAGASRNYLKFYPNDLLVWHTLEWGSDNNFRLFDFGGAGKPNEEYGVRKFKEQFGGKLVEFGRYEKIYSPVKMKIAKRGFGIIRKILYG